jgi:hypothetical protein
MEVLYRLLQCFDRTQAVDIAKDLDRGTFFSKKSSILAVASF